jgi:hypothetical protein
MKLKRNPTEYYVNKYSKLPKADKKRVVIVFSVNQDEIGNIKPFINSLLDQTVRVDDIAFTAPVKNKELIPKNLRNVINTYVYDKDYEDLGTIIPTVLREPESNTKIIIVEPNNIYREDFIQTMVEKSNENPDKIIYIKNRPKIMLIKPSFFKEDFCDYKSGNNCNEWFGKCCNNEKISIDYEDIIKV